LLSYKLLRLLNPRWNSPQRGFLFYVSLLAFVSALSIPYQTLGGAIAR